MKHGDDYLQVRDAHGRGVLRPPSRHIMSVIMLTVKREDRQDLNPWTSRPPSRRIDRHAGDRRVLGRVSIVEHPGRATRHISATSRSGAVRGALEPADHRRGRRRPVPHGLRARGASATVARRLSAIASFGAYASAHGTETALACAAIIARPTVESASSAELLSARSRRLLARGRPHQSPVRGADEIR